MHRSTIYGSDPASFLPLPEATFEILLALAEGERHGYAIQRDVAARTGGRVKLGPGTLYGAVKRLLAAGLIEERTARGGSAAGEERRRVYGLSGLGGRVVSAELARLESLVRAARRRGLRPTRELA